jgi:hypothetical protein
MNCRIPTITVRDRSQVHSLLQLPFCSKLTFHATGLLTLEEFLELGNALCIEFDVEETRLQFEEADVNGDGVLTLTGMLQRRQNAMTMN